MGRDRTAVDHPDVSTGRFLGLGAVACHRHRAGTLALGRRRLSLRNPVG
jgi:hypothetical protein